MLLKGIRYKGRVWARAAGDSARFVWGHKIRSTVAAVVLMIVAHVLIFGEAEGFSELRPVVSFSLGSLGWLSLVFLWNLVWAPFQIEEEQAVESERIIAHMRSENATLRNENSGFKKRLLDLNIDLEAIERLEEFLQVGDVILKENVGGFEMFLDWREQVSLWNDLVLDALPKSEQFGFETIAEWVELNLPVEKLGAGDVVNGYMRNGKAYMHAKTIKLRKIIMLISGT